MKNLICASLLGASAAILAGCHGSEPAAVSGPVQTMQAQVVESREQQVPQTIKFTGTVHARESSVVSAQVMGRIQQVLVREGDSVRAGQMLAEIEAPIRSSEEHPEHGLAGGAKERGSAGASRIGNNCTHYGYNCTQYGVMRQAANNVGPPYCSVTAIVRWSPALPW